MLSGITDSNTTPALPGEIFAPADRSSIIDVLGRLNATACASVNSDLVFCLLAVGETATRIAQPPMVALDPLLDAFFLGT